MEWRAVNLTGEIDHIKVIKLCSEKQTEAEEG